MKITEDRLAELVTLAITDFIGEAEQEEVITPHVAKNLCDWFAGIPANELEGSPANNDIKPIIKGFVKANERLPENGILNGKHTIRISGECARCVLMVHNSQISMLTYLNKTSVAGKDIDYSEIEWLDESLLSELETVKAEADALRREVAELNKKLSHWEGEAWQQRQFNINPPPDLGWGG